MDARSSYHEDDSTVNMIDPV